MGQFRKTSLIALFLATFIAVVIAEEAPRKSEDVIKEAQQLLALGKNDDAVKLLRGAIGKQEERLQKMPKDAGAAFELAQLQFELQEDEGAAKSIASAIAESPREAKYHAFQGKMLSYGDDKDATERAFQKAIELAPKEGTYYCQYSRFLFTLKKSEAAQAQLRKAIEAEPGFAPAYPLLAAHLAGAKKDDEVLAVLRQGVEKCPKDPLIRDALGQQHQLDGEFAEALEQYLAFADFEPDNLRPQAKLVQLHLSLGKPEESKKHLEKVYEIFKKGKADSESFCREQFTAGKYQVLGLEFFELKGVNPVKYYFQVNDETGKKIYAVSLGSYTLTTEAARTAKTIKHDERMYHLDFYQGREHRTYGMFPVTSPSYDEVRKMVVEIIAGTRKPLSASVRAEEKKVEPAKSSEK